VFIENMKLLDEDPTMARQIFLDLIEAQDRRALCGGHNPGEIFTMGPSIDPRKLFGKKGASSDDAPLEKTKPDYTVILESEGDSIFDTWFSKLLNHEGMYSHV
jgi:hypothetical protein